MKPGGTKQQRPLIPAVVPRISTSDVLKSCSQALSQPGPHLTQLHCGWVALSKAFTLLFLATALTGRQDCR